MSLTHSWLAAVGMKSLTRFLYVGSPWVESVVRGFLTRRRTFRPFSSMMRQKRSRPIGWSPLNWRWYMSHSFTPPIPGASLRTSMTYCRANSSRAALASAALSSYW